MSPHDVYSLLALLSKSQGSGVRLLKFSIGDFFDSHAAEPPTGPTGDEGIDNATAEISELSDSTIQPPSRAKRTADTEPCTASPPPLLSVPDTRTVSPVIDRPSPSNPPLSESMIKVAVENVAKPGYLNIPDASAVDLLHQALQPAPQQDGKAKTSNSNKRKRQEIEPGPSEVKQRKKQAVPTREQSSRYDILDNFRCWTDIPFIASKPPTIRTSISPSAPVSLINGKVDHVVLNKVNGMGSRQTLTNECSRRFCPMLGSRESLTSEIFSRPAMYTIAENMTRRRDEEVDYRNTRYEKIKLPHNERKRAT